MKSTSGNNQQTDSCLVCDPSGVSGQPASAEVPNHDTPLALRALFPKTEKAVRILTEKPKVSSLKSKVRRQQPKKNKRNKERNNNKVQELRLSLQILVS